VVITVVKWIFRQAESKDTRAIVALVDSAYRGETSRAGWTTEADLLDGRRTYSEEVEAIITEPHNKIIMLEDESQLIASVHIKKSSSNENGGRAYLGMFAVSPNFQNQGIGKAMLSYVAKVVVEEWQCREIEMTVIRQRVELIAWYEKLGYRVTGETRAFPYGDERYGIPKRQDLVLDVLMKRI